jgi:hypothetical protein
MYSSLNILLQLGKEGPRIQGMKVPRVCNQMTLVYEPFGITPIQFKITHLFSATNRDENPHF